MKTRKNIFIASIFLLSLLLVLVFRPINIGTKTESQVQIGKVQKIYEGGDMDIVFELQETGKRYYINRGLERGLSLEELSVQLIGKEITIRYPKHWTPLDPGSSIIHLSEIEYQNKILFSEY